MKTITIVGGGLAGLSLGIGLRQRGIPVVLWEAGHYPRHRVCGEFISGSGQDTVARLGLLDSIFEAGAAMARSAAFFSARTRFPARPLAVPAWCLSRFTLDALLADRFRKCGGELRENQRWQAQGVHEGAIRASGRRAQPVEAGYRWFGLKVHAKHVPLEADLEMHLSGNGYVGICRLKNDEVNVCGLFRRPAKTREQVPSWQQTLLGNPGSLLHGRLSGAVLDESSFCSVAGLSLQPRSARSMAECRLGDSLTMIPPVTGNGMSMAFEAAELAMEPLATYSRGQCSWTQAQQNIARSCDSAFRRRLAWAKWLQRIMFGPVFQESLAPLILRSAWLWRLMFANTR
jgi:2-polyprenyl-6-methoxyphenol hydroxylase-like FAD-dependent oxidoreductase